MVLSPSHRRILLSNPEFDGKELRFIHEAFELGHIATMGSFITEFEARLEERVGGGSIIALNSGTSAIHLALLLLGVGKEDEVICQTLTFAASANPIVYLGAQPIFVDSEKETWNICPNLLEETILDRISRGKLPKAIITVNLFGMPAKMTELMEVANRYGIPVLEDAAESLGSRINKQYCGTFGDIGIYSFNGNKVITTGGGGAIITSNVKWSKKARHLATQAKDNYPHYEHSSIGYNYKMNNLAAGIGLAQLDCLDVLIRKRRNNFNTYKAELGNLPGISFLSEPDGYFSNRWLTTIMVDEAESGYGKEALRLALEDNNIESRPVWKPMHLQPIYSSAPYYGGHTAGQIFERGLCLPSSSTLTKEEVDRVIGCFHKQYEKVYR